MKHLTRYVPVLIGVLAAFVAADGVTAGSPEPPAVPASFKIEVTPNTVAPGGEARIQLSLSAAEGVKINRYPRIKLNVPAVDGIVAAAEGSVGNDKAPPPGEMETNYFKKVDPVEVTLTIDPDAPAGDHDIAGKLTYFYCVAASGFCAPKTVPVEISLRVE